MAEGGGGAQIGFLIETCCGTIDGTPKQGDAKISAPLFPGTFFSCVSPVEPLFCFFFVKKDFFGGG